MNTIPYKIEPKVYSQIHLNSFCLFMNKADDDTRHLCFRRQENQQHEILHCKAQDELLDKCERTENVGSSELNTDRKGLWSY